MRHLFALLFAALVSLPVAASDDATALFAAGFPGLDGKPVALAALKGKPAVVNFWARWCGPCRSEIPHLAELARQHKAAGLQVVGIGVEDLGDSARDFVAAYEMDYLVVFAGAGKGVELMKVLGNTKAALPFTVVIDAEGRITTRKLGVMSAEEMPAAVAPLL